MARKICTIAGDIFRLWPKMNYAAEPYVKAMLQLSNPDDFYGCDRASTIVSYFLVNAQTWRGIDAKRIKAELAEMIK